MDPTGSTRLSSAGATHLRKARSSAEADHVESAESRDDDAAKVASMRASKSSSNLMVHPSKTWRILLLGPPKCGKRSLAQMFTMHKVRLNGHTVVFGYIHSQMFYPDRLQ